MISTLRNRPTNANVSSAAKVKSILEKERISMISTLRNRPTNANASSAAKVKSILEKERNSIKSTDSLITDQLQRIANTYSLTYALVYEFQRRNIPIFLAHGSHLGSCRHHGIIPFEEKDVDFAIFSTDQNQILSAIKDALASQNVNATIENTEYGYQIPTIDNFSHYYDFWIFHSFDNQVNCVGLDSNGGCDAWYYNFYLKKAPVMQRSDWFPPRYQMFGTQKMPIPATNYNIESTFYFEGGHWNTTCGPQRRWNPKYLKWEEVAESNRKCSSLYDKYPFVFLKENGIEQLRQGPTILHEIDPEA